MRLSVIGFLGKTRIRSARISSAAPAVKIAKEGSEQETVEAHVQKTLRQVVRQPSGLLHYPYLIPSAHQPADSTDRLQGLYLQTYDWDSFFQGVRFAIDGRPDFLKDTVLNFLTHVDENGFVPRTISPSRFWDYPDQCKPFLCQGAYIASKAKGDFSWLRGENFRKLALTLRYWETNRRGQDGLYVWKNAVESGVDNSAPILMTAPEAVEGVDLNCYLVREYKALSLIAKKIQLPVEKERYEKKAQELAERIRERMWDETEQIYYSLNSHTGEFIRTKDWTSFLPLWCGIASKEQAKAMIEKHLLNRDEFWSDFGIRSLSRSDNLYNNAKRGLIPGYSTVSNWQGPVWFLPNYLLMHGLLNYGYRKEAMDIARKMTKLLASDIRDSGGTHENYHAETGKPLWAPHFGSWNLLADRILIEAMTGRDPFALD